MRKTVGSTKQFGYEKKRKKKILFKTKTVCITFTENVRKNSTEPHHYHCMAFVCIVALQQQPGKKTTSHLSYVLAIK